MAPRRSALTPEYSFDDATAQYRYIATGRFVPRLVVRTAIDGYISNNAKEVKALAQQLRERTISLADWQLAMEKRIAKTHLANAAAAVGGWANMTPADYGRVGQLVKQELGGVKGVHTGLRGLVLAIENGLPLDGRFRNRAMSYAQAGRHTYHDFEWREMLDRKYDEVRSVLHVGDSCSECIALADGKWRPNDGTMVLPGARICQRNCHCSLEYRDSKGVKKEAPERGSWRRKKREREKEGLGDEPAVDWTDPRVLSYYSGGTPGASGIELLSPRLMQHLKTHTDPRQNEFGVLVDRETAEVVYMKEGLRRSITFETDVFDSIADCVPVHTHDEAVSFSPQDWTGFLNAANVNVEMLVTPGKAFILRKIPRQFDPLPEGLGTRSLREYWDERYDELIDDTQFQKKFDTGFDLHAEAIEIINREFAELHHVEYLVVDLL